MTPLEQRAVLAIVNRTSQGIRTTVSSRDFWREFGFPAVNTRRELAQAAKQIIAASNRLEAGTTAGTIADLYGPSAGGGLTTVGGPLETPAATVFARVPYYTPESAAQQPPEPANWKSVSVQVPWDTPLWQVYSIVAAAAGDIAEDYGEGEPDLTEIEYLTY